MNAEGDLKRDFKQVAIEEIRSFDIDYRVLEARLNLHSGFSRLSGQLGIDNINIVPFFRVKGIYN